MFSAKSFSPYFIIICLTLFIAVPTIPFQVNGQQLDHNKMVFDTIFVYDTVWTHETIYDTVWVYDTIFIDETLLRIEKLHPIDIEQIGFSPLGTKLVRVSPIINKQPPFSIPNKINQRIKPVQRYKGNSGSLDYEGSSYQKLTLNPAKGEFDPTVFLMGTFSVEGYSGPVFQNTRYVFTSDDAKNQAIKDATTSLTGLEYGLRINYQVSQLTIQTGIGMSQLKENFSYVKTYYFIDSTKQTKEVNRIVTLFDSLKFLNVDQLLQGDTVWTTYVYPHDTLVTTDSVYFVKNTTSLDTLQNEIITHNLLEIPLIFSWQWKFSKTAIQLKIGGINQFHLFSTGKAFSGDGTVGNIEDVTRFTKYNIALYGGIAYFYDLSKQIGIGIDAYYKYPLMKFGTGFNVSLYKQTYGLNFSIRYRFKNQTR